MNTNLLDLATKRLLEKFGEGSHKPGSGSAAALSTMLAVEMLRTVISLTTDKKRMKEYGKVRTRFLLIQKDLAERIYPELEQLFHEDAIEFDKVINIRSLRDNATDPREISRLRLEARLALKPAVEIPLRISRLSSEVARYSLEVFDNGFQSARGDTSVSINNSVATIAECLSILELNLQSCIADEWYDGIREKKAKIKEEYNYLLGESRSRLELLEKEAEDFYKYHRLIQEFKNGDCVKTLKSDQDLEELVTRFQNTLYVFHDLIWKGNTLVDMVDLLDPKTVLEKVLGYQLRESGNLGFTQHGTEVFEVAGLIDKSKRLVEYNSRLPEKVVNFTIAHELAHAVLHDQILMHRDRAMEGPSLEPRTQEEAQADKFAACFLMPHKLVRKAFLELFQTKRFEINGQTALGLGVNVNVLSDHCQTARDLSRLLAGTKNYAGKNFITISDKFKVSEEAMAIRLEELNLVSIAKFSNSTRA